MVRGEAEGLAADQVVHVRAVVLLTYPGTFRRQVAKAGIVERAAGHFPRRLNYRPPEPGHATHRDVMVRARKYRGSIGFPVSDEFVGQPVGSAHELEGVHCSILSPLLGREVASGS